MLESHRLTAQEAQWSHDQVSADTIDARLPERRPLSNLPKSFASVAVGLVIIVTAIATYAAWQVEVGRTHDRQRSLAQGAAAALETIMQATGGSLLGAQAIGVDGEVSERSFDAFASGVLSDQQSEFSALAYEPVLAQARRTAFEKEVGAKIKDRSGGVGFTTAPRRAEYAPVEFAQPDTVDTRMLIGFDLLGDPTRGPALAAARRDGAPRSTAPQLLATSNRPGLNIVQPVYAVGHEAQPPPDRPVLGFVSGVVSAEALGARVKVLLPKDTSLRIDDDAGQLFATSRNVPRDAPKVTINVLGRHFTVVASSRLGASYTWPMLILIAGLSATGFTARTFRINAARTAAMSVANEALDRANRNTAVLQELTARLSSSATSGDMAGAITAHLRSHEPDLAGSAVIMLAAVDSAMRVDDSIDLLPPALIVELEVSEESPLTDAARRGFALFGAADVVAPGVDPAALAVLPLSRGGETAAIVVLFYQRAQRFESEQRLRLTTVAALGSQALERALRFDEEHAMATVLQRSLLPHQLPSMPNVTIAVRYIPATETALVGGDWYDAFTVGSGIAVVVGDAVGHGVEAASAMGQLRSAMRVAMLAGEGPASTLTVLDTFVDHVQGASDATAVCAILDVETGTLRLSRAGHIPPLLLRGGRATYIEEGGSLPLGWPDHARSDAQIDLVAGDVIMLITDGVVERREGSLESQLGKFAQFAVAGGSDLEQLCDTLVREMGVERPSDDVVLLAVRYEG